MKKTSYTISVENAYHTIDELHHLLSSRGVKAKQSDLKEAVSALFGFETSNEMDAIIKTRKGKWEAQAVFDKRGYHKQIPGVVLKNTKNPLQLYDFFRKHRGFTAYIKFCEDVEVTGGYKFKYGDVLFCNDKYTALKMVLNWDAITQIEFKYWKDEGIEEYRERDGGYWELAFVGEGDEQYLGAWGTSRMCSSSLEGDTINSPDTSIEEVTKYFLDQLMQGDMPFFVDNHKEFESHLDCLIDEYYADVFSARTDAEFIKHVEKFLPYMGLESIVSMEVGNSPISYLEILKGYGAKFERPKLLHDALISGDLNVCRYLLENGNTLENLFTEDGSTTYFHSEAVFSMEGEPDDRAKIFYSTVHQLGVPLDHVDKGGCSPLHHAAKNGKEDLYKHLIALGADKDLKNAKGNTPEMIMDSVKKERDATRQSGSLFGGIFDHVFSDM